MAQFLHFNLVRAKGEALLQRYMHVQLKKPNKTKTS